MTKAILAVGYSEYVLDLKDAVTVAELLSKAEKHENKYHTNSSTRSHHIYENEESELASLKLITDSFYRMAKLAGKPEKS